ncbi:MAG: hypothetical protein L6Q78_05215 [Bacteroidia bacterium]|nr:hypothetical protein [Bacteroidia bacterium]
MITNLQLFSLNGLLFLISASLFTMSCSNRFSECHPNGTNSMNGGFEESVDGYPANWLLYTNKAAASGDFTLTLNSSDRVEGKQALEFSINTCSNKGGYLSPGFTNEFDAKPGRSYLISFYTKSSPETKWIFKLSGVTAKKGFGEKVISSPAASSNWEKHELKFTQPENAKRIRMELNVLSTGKFLIDGIEMHEVN